MDAELKKYSIWNRWFELVGERLAARTQPLSLQEGVLTLTVASSAWLNELSFMRADLVRRINEVLGSGTVNAIRFVVGQVCPSLPLPMPRVAVRAEVEIPPEYLKEVEQETDGVSDAELRGVIRNARLAHLRRRLRHG